MAPRGCRDKCFTMRLRDKPPEMSLTQPKGSRDENKAPKAAKGLRGFGTEPKDLSQNVAKGQLGSVLRAGRSLRHSPGAAGLGAEPPNYS